MKDNQHQRILLTGATGYIGRALLARLVREGRHVVALVRARDEDSARRRLGTLGEQPGVHVVCGDVCLPSFGLVPEVWRSISVVVHAAAMPKLAAGQEVRMRQLHIEAPRELARAVEAHGVDRVIYVSTAFVRPGAHGVLAEGPAGEGDGANPYETTKTEGEHAIRAALGSRVEIVRPGIVLPGTKQPADVIAASPLGAVFRAVQLLGRRELALPGRARVMPGFVMLEDVVVFLCARLSAEHSNGETWNLVRGTTPSLGEIVEAWNRTKGLPHVTFTRTGKAFRVWAPYWRHQRRWETAQTEEAASKAGFALRDVDAELFAELYERWCERTEVEGAA